MFSFSCYKPSIKTGVIFAGIIVWITLTGIGLKSYPGNLGIFIAYSSLSAAMLVAAWIGPKSYFYIFISIFWMLGFWMKTCVHVGFRLDYGEPIGAFNGSAEAWDHALIVSSLAMCAALLFRLGQQYVLKNRKNFSGVQNGSVYVPQWYVRYGAWIWCFTLVVILSVAVVNFRLGVFQIGLMPHVLPFKLNALIAAALNLGFPLWVATLIWWDVCLHRLFLFRFAGAIFEAVVGSISILSRGAYVYHTMHYLVSIGLNRKRIRLSRLVYASVVFIIASGVLVTSLLTTSVRKHLYIPHIQQHVIQSKKKPGLTKQQQVIQKNLLRYKSQRKKFVRHIDLYMKMTDNGISPAISRMVTLVVDRWVGLEGVLAISSYDRIGKDLFVNGWLENRSLSTKQVFNYIADSIYVNPKNTGDKGFLFSSVPGLVAMLYYSGSYLVVFAGVLLFFISIAVAESLVIYVIKNPFVASFFGIYMANMVAQFASLHGFLVQVFEFGMILACIVLLQTYGPMLATKP